MASPYRYEERILKAAREHFSAHGFFGARVDSIADEARLNKRMVYEYNHTKEGLYLAVLSRVSLDFMDLLNQNLPPDMKTGNAQSVFKTLFKVFHQSPAFIRLWAWETMDGTIHGPRILQTADEVFMRLRNILSQNAADIGCKKIDDEIYKKIILICQGYLHSVALCLDVTPKPYTDNSDTPEETYHEERLKAEAQLNLLMGLEDSVLLCINKLLGLHTN